MYISLKKLSELDKKLFKMLIKNRRILYFLVFLLYPLVLLTIFYFSNEKYEFLKELGSLTFNILMIILISKPLVEIFQLNFLRKYLTFRRELGIIVFYNALFHSFILLIMSNYNFNIMFNLIKSNKSFAFGLIALLILFLLFITSNDFSMKKLKRFWKILHRLVYLIPLLIFLHIFFLVKEEAYELLPIIILFYVLKVIEFLGLRINIKKFFIKRSYEN